MKSTRSDTYVLAVETSGIACGVSLGREAQPLATLMTYQRQAHSRVLASLITEALRLTNITPGQLKVIGISAGPGSFTGLRIGFSLVKGLAHGFAIPCIAIPTLDLLAYQLGPRPGTVVALINAHRGEVFWKKYRWQATQLQSITEPQLSPIATLGKHIPESPLTLVSPDLPLLQQMLENQFSSQTPLYLHRYPSPETLLELTFARYQDNHSTPLEQLEPLYMRTFKGVS